MTHVIPGRRPVVEALRAGRDLDEILVGRGSRGLEALHDAAQKAGVTIRAVDAAALDETCGGVAHQGVVAIAGDFAYTDHRSLAAADLLVALDGVTDPQNLGAIARSAEQAGAGGLLLPRRRAAHVTPAAEKAAAGAFSWLRVAVVPNLVRALADLADAGLWSVGLDADADEELWSCALLDSRVVVVVGAEGRGLSRLVRERTDARVRIPTRGHLDSLNVGVAAALTLFEVVRRHAMSA